MRKKGISVATGALVVIFLAYGALDWPLPIERTLKTETSPDGTRTATYSWRPCGLLGAITKDNPWVYLTIRDQASGRVVARYSTSADVPEEAERRLASQKPW